MISYNQDAMKTAISKLEEIQKTVGNLKTKMEGEITSVEGAIQGTHAGSVAADLNEIPDSVVSISTGIGTIITTLNHVITEYNKMGY